MARCRLCAKAELSAKTPPDFDICGNCARTLGVVPLGPPIRPARPCDRCNGMQFVRVVPRELTAGRGDFAKDVNEQAAPMTLTIAPTVTENVVFSGNTTRAPEVWNGRGRVETYVCTGCGFMEWYCLDYESIPLGPEYMADLVDYASDSPYR